MSEPRKYNTDALFIFPLIGDGVVDFVTDYTPAAGDAKVWTDKLISTNPTALILGFDSLSELPANGAQLDENGAGTAEGVVAFTVITSGTVGGGDAAGFFFMRSVTGQAWSNNDQIDINGGNTNIATADSTTYDLAATAGLIADLGNGQFAAALSPTEMSCAQGNLVIVDSATKAIEDQTILFHTFGNASALLAQDLDQTLEAGADAALVTRKLDHLVAVAESDDPVDNSIIAKMVDASGTANWSSFINSEDSLRAISEAVAAIGSATGGGFNFAPLSGDVLEDTIDDAAAVDKSTTPATVGIPVTGAAAAGWLAGDECTIAGTTNYNASFVIDSVTTNEVVIVSSFTAETFSSDTIKRTIKATRLVGTQDGGTFASVASQDLVYHIIGDTANNFTISYRFAVGGGRIATEIDFTGYLSGSNDTALIQAYDFVGSAWETRATFDGQNGTVNQVHNATLLLRHTGTSGVELGQVLVRIKQGAASSSPTLNIDTLLVEAVGVAILGLHENGSIWIDTDDGVDGTEEGVNGTSNNPVKTWADAQTMLTATNRHNVHVINGSSFTLDNPITKYSFFGDNWDLALGGQAVNNCHFEGATITGVSTGTGNGFHGGEMGTCTLAGPFHVDRSILAGTITIDASEVEFERCTMSGTPVIKFTGANTTVHMHGYQGAVTIEDMGDSGTDVMHIDGSGSITTSSCAGGTVHYRGEFKITDSGGNTTFNASDQRVDVVAILTRLGAPLGASVSADIADVKAVTIAILVDTGTTLQDELDAIQAAVITNATGVDIAADIIAMKAETVLIVADTNELQTDWKNTGRLDTLLDAIPTTAMRGTDSVVLSGPTKAQMDTAHALLATPAQVNTEVDNAFTTQMADSVPADGTISTREQALYAILQVLTDFSISGTTMTVRKVDGSTQLFTLELDDGTSPTDLTRT